VAAVRDIKELHARTPKPLLKAPKSREKVLTTIRTLRQQSDKTKGRPNYALADFIAPRREDGADRDRSDHIGAFAVTAGNEVEEYARTFKDSGDDYTAIMIQALADRFAEGLAELLHRRVRESMGFGKSEGLGVEDLIKERYRGIRPAAGYPSQPDHTEKQTIWDLLDAETHTGATLTTSFAMHPGSAVSGLYFAHPKAKYFQVGPIDKDQMQDYAGRKGLSLEECEKWLAPNRGY